MTSKILFFLSTTILFSATAFSQQKQFEGVDGCFILYDLKADKQLAKYGDKRCAERVASCSTFKVPLALMAFDKGVLKDENDLLKWDGVKHDIESWNHDQTAASWMRDSVVWYSQALTPKLGKDTIEKYLRKFGYGNHDMSGGFDVAWLTEVPSKTTLRVSAEEQIKFIAKLFKNQLPVSKHALDTAKKIMYIEKSGNGFELSGKTGSGSPVLASGQKVRVGWFVSHVKRGDHELVAVTAFTDTRKDPPYKYGGPFAKAITKAILTEKGYWTMP
ncbi:MAG: penicillin-binding transpeptidase domain-containing protein [Proteobacteria bacterium]|nr:penicillin-binding transpeptidase domain-containing protein [Pseudomonadota bacterium]